MTSKQSYTRKPLWSVAPHLLEDVYNLQDALVVGTMLITLINHCDRVKIACLAQLVNAIAPIMTQNGGGAWRQTIYYPFLHASLFGRGMALMPVVDCPKYDCKKADNVPVLDVAVVWNPGIQELTVFAVNKDVNANVQLNCDLRNFEGYTVADYIVLSGADRYATNTADNMFNVRPHRSNRAELDHGMLKALLPNLSWNVIRLRSLTSL